MGEGRGNRPAERGKKMEMASYVNVMEKKMDSVLQELTAVEGQLHKMEEREAEKGLKQSLKRAVSKLERGCKAMLKYFSSYFTEEQLKENMARYNLQTMFDIVKRYFAKEYGYTGTEIELSNLYQNSINSYIYNDKVNPAFVHIDELFESTVMGFLLAMFKWSKDFDNLETYGECFKYVLFLMNDVCIFGEMQGMDANQALMDTVNGDIQILQLSEDCYWTIVAFSLAHEIAHAYLAAIGRKYTREHPEKEEYDADMIAYHIVLKIIMEEKGSDTVLEDYTYLAPMMYMDFFDLYYYTDRVLYKTVFHDWQHPAPVKRKNRLFAVADKDNYDFNTVDGNHLYSGFLDVYDEFKDQILMKMERGKLNKVLWTEKRERIQLYPTDNRFSLFYWKVRKTGIKQAGGLCCLLVA